MEKVKKIVLKNEIAEYESQMVVYGYVWSAVCMLFLILSLYSIRCSAWVQAFSFILAEFACLIASVLVQGYFTKKIRQLRREWIEV